MGTIKEFLLANNEEPINGQPKSDGEVKITKSASKPRATPAKAKPAAPKAASPSGKKATPVKPTVKPAAAKSELASSALATAATNSHDFLGVDAPGEAKPPIWRYIGAAVGVLVLVLIVFGVLIYGYKSDNVAVRAVARVVPYPVEMVNGHFVAYKDYLFEVDANERAYENNAKLNNQPAVDFTSSGGKKLATQIKQHVLAQLESEALVAQLASQNHVTVTSAQVTTVVNQLASRNGGEQTLLKVLNQTYGWNLNDLRGVIYKELLQQNLETKITSDPTVQAAAQEKAKDVLSQINGGGDFATLAKKYSQASDAASGGDLGYVTTSQLPAQEQSVANSLQINGVSGVIKTQYGYEIIKLLDKRSDGSMHIQHILIETVDFNQYFQAQYNKAKVTHYITV